MHNFTDINLKQGIADVYKSDNLTEYLDYKLFSERNIGSFVSNNSSLSTMVHALGINSILGSYQICFRDRELHSANCDTDENLQFAFPLHQLHNKSIGSNDRSRSCLLSIIPAHSQSVFVTDIMNIEYYAQILHISKLEYNGTERVQVVSGYNGTFTLFDFDSNTVLLWNNTIVYGQMVSFIIPNHGQLYIEYESVNSADEIQVNSFV